MNSKRTAHWLMYLLPVLAAVIMAILIKSMALAIPLLIIGLCGFAFFIFKIVNDLRWGFYILLCANFLSAGLTRYVDLPLGLLIDFILLFIFFVYFFQHFRTISWAPLSNPVFLVVCIWMVINIMELVNPEAHSFEAWFYAMRGVALYFFLVLLVGYLCLEHQRDFNWFITIWFVFSMIGTLWGIKQLYIGLDSAEQAWLSVPGNLSTHLLFGKLRVFSFYSDAGQFGASQAHTAVVASILAIFESRKARRLFYLITAVCCFYGMLISGTRGAIAIPLIGFFTYLILIRNFKIIIIGSTILGIIFCILKFTFIGQGNYEIRRMRTSLDPNDASLMVRIENQKKLAVYLQHHVLGGGVGSGGYWGLRFSPNTFLANLALDSWYVRIAAEYGYPGLVLYLLMLLYILYYALRMLQAENDITIRNQRMAVFCGLVGILVASYTNQVFGQMPTGLLIYLSIVFLTKKSKVLIHAT